MKYLIVLALFVAAGCGGGGGGSTLPTPVALTTPIAVMTPAATPTVVATSVPTPSPTPVLPTFKHMTALGDSITACGAASDCAHAFPALVAAAIGAQLTNLGIGGEVAVPTNTFLYDRTPALQIIYGGVLADEVSQIPLDSDIVTLFIGTNDEWLTSIPTGVNGQDQIAGFSAETTNFNIAFRAIVSAVRARVPAAVLVTLTVPNSAYRNVGSSSSAIKAGVTSFSNAIKANAQSLGDVVVDLACEPGMYAPGNYAAWPDVHPNNAGHAVIAADVISALRAHTRTVQSCSYDTAPL